MLYLLVMTPVDHIISCHSGEIALLVHNISKILYILPIVAKCITETDNIWTYIIMGRKPYNYSLPKFNIHLMGTESVRFTAILVPLIIHTGLHGKVH